MGGFYYCSVKAGLPIYCWYGETTYHGVNDMYTKAYEAGYQTVFVQLYDAAGNGSENQYTNGRLPATMLGQISQHFNGQKVNIIAHSKGGPDTQAALIHFGPTLKTPQKDGITSLSFKIKDPDGNELKHTIAPKTTNNDELTSKLPNVSKPGPYNVTVDVITKHPNGKASVRTLVRSVYIEE